MPSASARNALVTGAGRRIGRAIALDLAARGWGVVVHYSASVGEATDVVREIEKAGGRAVAARADFRAEEEAAALISGLGPEFRPLACLVNNASLFENDGALTATRQSWDAHMQVNLRAPFVLSQEFVRQLPERESGNIVNVLDERVWNLTPFFTSYTVSKAGLWTLTRTLALAFAPRVRVNAIGPGPTLPSRRQSEAQFRAQWSQLPLRRPATPEDVCAALRFILDAPTLTGQMIALDGGQHLGWSHRPQPPPADE
jgi:NAD(P)-dependent dehydrogenase (short-subunit alcohol dehydrogenase family)